MRIFETPSVYFESGDAGRGGVDALRTDVAGFVGIAERGPLHLAVPIESYRQYQSWFGNPAAQGYLAFCVRAFFENGGRRCWVVRVASDAAATAGCTLCDAGARPMWDIEAAGPGVWGNAVAIRAVEVRRQQVRGTRNPLDPRLLQVDSVAGLSLHTLLEVRGGGTAFRAVVTSVDAKQSQVGVDPALPVALAGTELLVESVAYTIEVYEQSRLVALYEDLSLVPGHDRYGPALLKQPWQILDVAHPNAELAGSTSAAAIDYFRVATGRHAEEPPPIVVRERRDQARLGSGALLEVATARLPLAGGADGLAALSVRDFVGEALSPYASDTALALGRRGLAALAVVDEVSVLAVPDIHLRPRPVNRIAPPPVCDVDPCLPPPPPQAVPAVAPTGDAPPQFSPDAIAQVQAAMVEQCERLRDRIALLDAPFGACTQLGFTVGELRAWRQRFDSAFAALYAPWLAVVDLDVASAATDDLTRPIPPCGHVAGMIAAGDLQRGVHVAPANVPLRWAEKATLAIDPTRHGMLNSMGINVIRAEAGRGLRVLGARTLSSDPDWRYLNVRRLVNAIAKAIQVSIQWAVFEPNHWRTRAKLALVIGSFLQELWTKGALAGTAPNQGFFVQCNDDNNPPDGCARGELVIDVGIAPSVPFEFIVLRIGRDANCLSVSETGSLRGAA